MKKRIIILSALTIFLFILITAFIQYGYFEYILDNRKIDRENKDFSAVVTLSIGPNALIMNPHYTIIQIRSDKTITENTFRAIRWEYNPLHITTTQVTVQDATHDDRTAAILFNGGVRIGSRLPQTQ